GTGFRIVMFELALKTLVRSSFGTTTLDSVELPPPTAPVTVTHSTVMSKDACAADPAMRFPVPSLSIATTFPEISTSAVLGVEQELGNSFCIPTSVVPDGRLPINGLNCVNAQPWSIQ